MRRILPLYLLLPLAVLLGGCGFHLRGNENVDALQVEISDQALAATGGTWLGNGAGELTRVLTDTLAAAGVRQASGGLRIELLSEGLEKRVASVGASASAAEYQLDYSMRFRVVGADGAKLIDDTRVQAERSYRYKPNAILGSAEEEAALQYDMRRDVARQVLQRLRQAALRVRSGAQPDVIPSTSPHAPQP